nr:hypothetical protein [Candidatus Freyarchaeota archaeon]
MEIVDPIISFLVGLGLNAQDAHTLVSKLQTFSPQHRRRILEDVGLPAEIHSTLLLLFEERDETKQLELKKTTRKLETIEKQLKDKAKEGKLEELNEITGKEKIVIVPYKVKEQIPGAEPNHMPGYTSPNKYFENKEMVEKWLSNTERSFSQMTLEMQEDIMPRYIQLRALTCKDKKEMSSSCIGCLIGNTIDCPLFNPPKLKRMAK